MLLIICALRYESDYELISNFVWTDFRLNTTTARSLAPMRWQVATLAAVWLVILSWCGSTALPVDARPEKAVPANEERATRNNSDGDDLWNLIEESALSEATNEDDNFRRPASQQDVFYVPLKRLPANIDDEPVIFNYAINQPVSLSMASFSSLTYKLRLKLTLIAIYPKNLLTVPTLVDVIESY